MKAKCIAPPRAQVEAHPAADYVDAELEQTGLDERRPGQWQRFGDVGRRVVEKAKRDG